MRLFDLHLFAPRDAEGQKVTFDRFIEEDLNNSKLYFQKAANAFGFSFNDSKKEDDS